MMESKKKVWDVNIIYVLTVVVFFLEPYALYGIMEVTGWEMTSVQSLIITQVILIIPAMIYLIFNKLNLFQFIRLKKINFLTVFLLVIFTMFLIPVMNVISTISLLYSTNHIGSSMSELADNSNLLVCVLSVAVVPALFEETIYRGVFYNVYRKANLRQGILISALLFALLHMNWNQFTYTFIMGIIFALIIEATDSIASTMVIHGIINGFSIIIMKIQPMLLEFLKKADPDYKIEDATNAALSKMDIIKSLPQLLITALICGGIAFAIFYVIANQNNRWDHIKDIFRKNSPEEKSQKVSLVTIPLIIIMVIEVIAMIALEVKS